MTDTTIEDNNLIITIIKHFKINTKNLITKLITITDNQLIIIKVNYIFKKFFQIDIIKTKSFLKMTDLKNNLISLTTNNKTITFQTNINTNNNNNNKKNIETTAIKIENKKKVKNTVKKRTQK